MSAVIAGPLFFLQVHMVGRRTPRSLRPVLEHFAQLFRTGVLATDLFRLTIVAFFSWQAWVGLHAHTATSPLNFQTPVL